MIDLGTKKHPVGSVRVNVHLPAESMSVVSAHKADTQSSLKQETPTRTAATV